MALSVRLMLDDKLLMRHVSAVEPNESIADALSRVACTMKESCLASIEVLHGEVNQDETFPPEESVTATHVMRVTPVTKKQH